MTLLRMRTSTSKSGSILLRLRQQISSPLPIQRVVTDYRDRHRCCRSLTTTTAKPNSNPGDGNSTTYYDSQSGVHVALPDDENEISLFVHLTSVDCSEYLEPRSNRYKGGDASSDDADLTARRDRFRADLTFLQESRVIPDLTRERFKADLRFLRREGFRGAVLDDRNASTALLADGDSVVGVVPDEFTVFLVADLLQEEHAVTCYPDNVHLLFDYTAPTPTGTASTTTASTNQHPSLTDTLSRHVANGNNTTIAIVDHDHLDPILTASGIATLLDDTGGGDTVWLGTTPSRTGLNDKNKAMAPMAITDPDRIVALVEELSYLDIPGPTMKSRLIVDLIGLLPTHAAKGMEKMAKEAVEEFLSMGLNRFAVRRDRLEWLQGILKENGKELCTTATTRMESDGER